MEAGQHPCFQRMAKVPGSVAGSVFLEYGGLIGKQPPMAPSNGVLSGSRANVVRKSVVLML